MNSENARLPLVQQANSRKAPPPETWLPGRTAQGGSNRHNSIGERDNDQSTIRHTCQPSWYGEGVFSEATLPALNSAMVNRGIDPHAIITIIEMHGQTMASRTYPQFRVLYEVC